jgi:hypothetical protein
MITCHGQSDVMRSQTQAARDGIDFNLPCIREDFTKRRQRSCGGAPAAPQ